MFILSSLFIHNDYNFNYLLPLLWIFFHSLLLLMMMLPVSLNLSPCFTVNGPHHRHPPLLHLKECFLSTEAQAIALINQQRISISIYRRIMSPNYSRMLYVCISVSAWWDEICIDSLLNIHVSSILKTNVMQDNVCLLRGTFMSFQSRNL